MENIRKNTHPSLAGSLDDKQSILKDIHHRVKNDLQLLSSLLHLHGQHAGLPEVEAIVSRMQDRIGAVALLHENFYQSEDLTQVTLSEYLRDIAKRLVAHERMGRDIRLHVEPADICVSADTAMPCGLIADELVMNALKHAFIGRRTGTIHIVLSRVPPAGVRMRIADDGIGMPPHVCFQSTRTLGLQLVCTLVEQLNGKIVLSPGEGTQFEVSFGDES